MTTQGDYITFSWLMSENVFAKAISKLADENLRKSMIENCEKAAEPFDVEHSKKAMQDIYFEMLN